VNLKTGDVIPVDGIVIKSKQIMTNEAAMTGESDERRKEPLDICLALRKDMLEERATDKKEPSADHHELPSPVLMSGTSVENGSGDMLVIVVGKNSALGEIMDKLEESQGATPLQEKLEIIAEEIGKLGTYAALMTIHVLLFRYFLDGLLKRNIDLFGGETDEARPFIKNFKMWVDYVIIGVAVIVVAVPEGLPLAVMISLAYSQGKMLKDNNYVKKLAACEIMGGATNICSDKTGTLTLNKMKVAHIWLDKDFPIALE
jgi:magnesium-transporting ATPase (P-type)